MKIMKFPKLKKVKKINITSIDEAYRSPWDLPKIETKIATLAINEEKRKQSKIEKNVLHDYAKSKKKAEIIIRKKKKRTYLHRLKKNRKVYWVKRKIWLLEKRREGNRKGLFSIYLCENYKRTKFLGAKGWLLSSIAMYEKLIEENLKENILCAKRCDKYGKPFISEIILVEKLNEEDKGKTSYLKDELGSFKEHRTNIEGYLILTKNKWQIPQTYGVFEDDEFKEETGLWIYNNIICKNVSIKNMKNVYTYKKMIIVQYTNDIDIILAPNEAECLRLYLAMERLNKGIDVIYTGEVSKTREDWVISQIKNKTGFSREKINKINKT